MRTCQLNARIRRNHFGHAAGYQQQGFVVVPAPHQRNGFALKTADLAIGQNRLQSVTHFNASAVIPDGVKDQNPAIGGFRADPPFLEEVDRVTLDVGPIQGIDGHDGNLGVSLFVDLPADVRDLCRRIRAENVREIVDVTCGLELRNRLCPRQRA